MVDVDDTRPKSDGGDVSSPVARKLRIKRRAPGGRSDWSGCGTMDGLNRAADSKEYSQRK